MCVRCELSCLSSVPLFASSWSIAHRAPLSMDSPGKNTGVGWHGLLQGIFPTQGWNPCLLRLLHWQAGSLPLVLPEKPSTVSTMHVYYRKIRKDRSAKGDIVLSENKITTMVESRLFYSIHLSEAVWKK